MTHMLTPRAEGIALLACRLGNVSRFARFLIRMLHSLLRGAQLMCAQQAALLERFGSSSALPLSFSTSQLLKRSK